MNDIYHQLIDDRYTTNDLSSNVGLFLNDDTFNIGIDYGWFLIIKLASDDEEIEDKKESRTSIVFKRDLYNISI